MPPRRLGYNTGVATLLDAKALTKRYGQTMALESVDFQVQEGITGLLGPNGAGKSTAIKLFLGLLKPTSGSAEVLGQKPYESLEVRARLGYMPEHDCLPTAMTAAEFLTHMVQVSGIPPSQARTRSADILRHVGLQEERYRPIGQYSTGMKQRVKLAQSLAPDPVLVLLDEPTSALDPRTAERLLDCLLELNRREGVTLLIASHRFDDAQRLGGRLAVLIEGRLRAEGETERILAHPPEQDVAAFLSKPRTPSRGS